MPLKATSPVETQYAILFAIGHATIRSEVKAPLQMLNARATIRGVALQEIPYAALRFVSDRTTGIA